MYTLSGSVTCPAVVGSKIFLLPNTAVGALRGEPIDEVTFNRDELANLVWAVEHKYWSTQDEQVINRDDLEAQKPPPNLPSVVDKPIYRLKSTTPVFTAQKLQALPGSWIKLTLN
jgi:hypothetical protein